MKTKLSTADFDLMSWHDNPIHAFRIVEGENGQGDFVLDIDHIEEWIPSNSSFQFRLQPATLRFFGVSGLKLAIDFSASSIALGPISIYAIERRTEKRERYVAQLWRIVLNSPEGLIEFEASGFEQTAWGPAVVSQRQQLLSEERKGV